MAAEQVETTPHYRELEDQMYCFWWLHPEFGQKFGQESETCAGMTVGDVHADIQRMIGELPADTLPQGHVFQGSAKKGGIFLDRLAASSKERVRHGEVLQYGKQRTWSFTPAPTPTAPPPAPSPAGAASAAPRRSTRKRALPKAGSGTADGETSPRQEHRSPRRQRTM
jgi:hypothetical protein